MVGCWDKNAEADKDLDIGNAECLEISYLDKQVTNVRNRTIYSMIDIQFTPCIYVWNN